MISISAILSLIISKKEEEVMSPVHSESFLLPSQFTEYSKIKPKTEEMDFEIDFDG